MTPEARLVAFAARRLAALDAAPLAELVAGRGLPMFERELGELLAGERVALAAWLRGPAPVRGLAEALARWLWRKNQYLRLDRAALEAACGDGLRDMADRLDAADGPDAALAAALAAEAGLRGRVFALVRASAGERPREVVCSEYAPTLQLDALGLAEAPLRAPILDVGCGASAGLVRALRAQGRAATGVDRAAPDDVALVGDWLTFPYGQGRWGTVLSHHGFSLHFLHHHHAQGPEAYAYAQAYMAILRSLEVGGLFAYVPGLPFIEGLLPAGQYRCTRVTLPAALQGIAGFEVEYAAHVERLA